MADSYHIEIEGWEELEAKLRRMAKEINTQEVMENALMDGAEVVKEFAEVSAPRLTGQLAGDIAISKKGRQKYSVRIGPGLAGFYGRFQEYGTSRMAAQPWLRPAFDAARGIAEREISISMWRAVEEANRG